ncbi:MAG: cation transporter [Alphaproteobacteria bacterium]|nr:MAG: cation transporter [Alphaproteobacteria bacterium]
MGGGHANHGHGAGHLPLLDGGCDGSAVGERQTSERRNEQRTLAAFAIIVIFMVVEIAGAFYANSLALLADAGHMASDALALGLAFIAFRLARRPRDERRTFGYARLEVLAAFVNGLGLLVLVGWIAIEAIGRFLSPPEIRGLPMLTIAIAGLAANLVAFAMLHGAERDNLNIRAALWHVAGDILGSLAAIGAAIVILATGWTPIDPLLSLFVALLLLRAGWSVLKPSAHILMEGSPPDVDLDELQRRLVAEVPGVAGVHHLHLWSLTDRDRLLTAHLEVRDPGEGEAALAGTKEFLKRRYDIRHSTLQIERAACGCADARDGRSDDGDEDDRARGSSD